VHHKGIEIAIAIELAQCHTFRILFLPQQLTAVAELALPTVQPHPIELVIVDQERIQVAESNGIAPWPSAISSSSVPAATHLIAT
jgi:hypothetical protein